MEQLQKEKEDKDRELQCQREAAREKRARAAQSVNLTSQSEIMACIEKSFNDTSLSPDALLLNLSRTKEDVL